MPTLLILRIFTPFALGYLFVSVFRSINSVLAPHLMRDLDLSATELGFAVSALFLSAAILQLPIGVLLDRFDPRRIYAFFLLLAAVGSIVTALAQDMAGLAIGRGMVALGTASSAASTFKFFSMWFPADRLPLANGLSIAAGGLGFMTGTVPVEFALGLVSWRAIFFGLGAILVGVAALVFFAAPHKTHDGDGQTLRAQIFGLLEIMASLRYWRIAPLTMMVLGSLGALNQLWAGPWLRDVAGFSPMVAANLLFVIAISVTLGGLLIGPSVNAMQRIGIDAMGTSVAFAIVTAAALAPIFLQWQPTPVVVFAAWGLFGLFATLFFASYPALAAEFPKSMTGRVTGCMSLSWTIWAFALQNFYGFVLDRYPATPTGFAPAGHRAAVGILFTLLIASIGWYFLASFVLRRRDGAMLSAPSQ